MSFIEVESLDICYYSNRINKRKVLISTEEIVKIEEFERDRLISEAVYKTVSCTYLLFFQKKFEARIEPAKYEKVNNVSLSLKNGKGVTLDCDLETFKKILNGVLNV